MKILKKYIIKILIFLIVILITIFTTIENTQKNNNPSSYYDVTKYGNYKTWINYYDNLLNRLETNRKKFLLNTTQTEKRNILSELLGIKKQQYKFSQKLIKKVTNGNIRFEKYYLNIEDGYKFECYVLIPKNNNGKGVVAFPASNWNIDIISGIKDYGNISYALRLAEKGYTLIVPELPLCDNNSYKEQLLQLTGILTNKPVIGEWIKISNVCLDFLENKFNIKPPYGAIGWSAGGLTAYFSAALNIKIKAVSVLHYLGTYKKLLLSQGDHISNYIPGILQYFEYYDIACMIAPRFLFFQIGKNDSKFPFKDEMYSYNRIKNYFIKNNSGENIKLQIISGGHKPAGSMPIMWIKNNL